MRGRTARSYLIDGLVWLLIVGVDRVVKAMALSSLSLGVQVPVGSILGIHWFWTLTYNQGAAWGVFAGFPMGLLFFRICFISVLFAMYLQLSSTIGQRIALISILAGACSNIIDTVAYGHVIDMIHVRLWGWDYPVFNVADMSICLGALAIAILTFSHRKRPS